MPSDPPNTAPHLLLTGATGFLGRRLLQTLTAADASQVTALTRAATPPALPCAVPTRWLTADLDDLDAASLPARADALLHMAAPTPRSAPADAHQRQTVEGTRRLLAWALGAGVRHVIFVSTINVYAPAVGACVVFDESAPYITPGGVNATDYGLTKRQAEALLEAAALEHPDVALTILRPSLVYGPGMSSRSPLAYIARALTSGEQVTLAAPDGHYLTPAYIDDVCDVLRWSLRTTTAGTFNVGGPEHKTEGDIARALASHLLEPLAFIDNPQPALSLAVSSARLDAAYPNRPQTKLRAGLAATFP